MCAFSSTSAHVRIYSTEAFAGIAELSSSRSEHDKTFAARRMVIRRWTRSVDGHEPLHEEVMLNVAKPLLGKLPLAGAAALASEFVLGRDQSRRDPQRSKKLLKNSRSDRRREIESLPQPLRQSPNVSSSNTSRSSSSTAGKRSRAKEYQSSRASHVLTSSQSRQRSYDSSSDNPSCRWKKPIRDEKGYDSGYASGSDQTYDYNQVRSGPRRSSGRRSQRNTKR